MSPASETLGGALHERRGGAQLTARRYDGSDAKAGGRPRVGARR
ncbi:hypothetical protein ACWDA7_26560 [Streptomyces sp. NPDC001156]